ncbi:MAG TPA: PAS domain S-box protein [Polyangiales bacterium]|nr:PAS domain S-box protein [Polyangiales bacterium]
MAHATESAAVRAPAYDADDSLRESEARFRGTFENAPVGIAHVGLDGRWLRVNDKLCSIVGYDRTELSALTFQDITWPDDLAADIAYVEQMLAGTIRTYAMEKRYVRKDRSLVWINLTVSLLRTPAGEPDYFISFVEDISARKAAEAALRESEARFVEAQRSQELARFFDLALDLACVANVEGYFVHLNPEFHRVLGYSAEELLRTPIMELVHPDDHETTMSELGKLSSGVPMIAYTNRYRCKDGRYRWLAWRAAPVVNGLIYALARDVTADREIMEALRVTEDRYHLITDSVTDYSMILLDPGGCVLSWNAGAERILGYSAAEMLGEHVSKLHPDRAKACAMLDSAAEHGRHEDEGWRVRKDGTKLWANVVITALRNADGVLQGFAKITRDFSQRHEAELALRAHQTSLAASLKEREVLLQEVHHRVKNNLQVISSLMNMQQRLLEDTIAIRALDECRTRVEAIALIHEQLYQSRDYTNVPFDPYVRNLAHSVFRGASGALGRIKLTLDLEPIALAVDRAIPCGLMLNELLTNAVEHAFPDGRTGEVRIGLHVVDGTLELTVADDGVSIPEDKRSDFSSSLGLELVSILVEQIQGTLQTSYEAGTSFRIVFPREG